MKKILIFSTAYFPFVGGAEVAIKEISDRIDDIQLDMITARLDKKLPKTERIGNVNVYRVGIGQPTIDKFLLPFFGFLKALKLNKKNNYNIVWSIMASHASIAAAFIKIKFLKIKLLLTLQEGDEEEHLKRYVFGNDLLYKIFIQPWHLLVFKKADYATAISNDLKQRALRGGVKCEVKVVPNGVDLNQFSITNFQLRIINFRNKLGIKSGQRIVITTSRLAEKNGIRDLIDAINILIKKYKLPVKLIICGSGKLKEKLELRVASYGLQDKVLFLGQVDQDELPKYLWISDVFCRPSLSEGLGNSFLEAMAASLPVIATPVGGIPDFLEDGESSFAASFAEVTDAKKVTADKTGWFCKVQDPKSIAEKIKYILDEENKEEVARVVQSAKKLVEEKYNWEIITVKFKEIFNKF